MQRSVAAGDLQRAKGRLGHQRRLCGRSHEVLLVARRSTRDFPESVFWLYLHTQCVQVTQRHLKKFLQHRFLAQQDSNLRSFKSVPTCQRRDVMYWPYTSLIKWNKLGEKGRSYKIFKNLILKQLQNSKAETLLGQKCGGLASDSA